MEVIPELKGNECFVQKCCRINEDMLFIVLTSQKVNLLYVAVGICTLSSRNVHRIWIIQRQDNLVEGIFYFSYYFFLRIYLS